MAYFGVLNTLKGGSRLDSTDKHSRNHIEAITDALKSGALTPAEMVERLCARVDEEMSKKAEDINAELVMACEELLWNLDAHQTVSPLESRKEKQRTALKAYLEKASLRATFVNRVTRVVAAAAAVLALLFLGDIVLKREWLKTTQSEDEQQLILAGQSVKPGLVNESLATGADELRILQTEDLSEAAQVAGFLPPVPSIVPAGWSLGYYFVSSSSEYVSMKAVYKKSGQDHLLRYSFIRYKSAGAATEEFEQNKGGSVVAGAGGNEVYVTENIDDTLCVWRSGLDCYSLSAPLDLLDMMEIINSITTKEN